MKHWSALSRLKSITDCFGGSCWNNLTSATTLIRMFKVTSGRFLLGSTLYTTKRVGLKLVEALSGDWPVFTRSNQKHGIQKVYGYGINHILYLTIKFINYLLEQSRLNKKIIALDKPQSHPAKTSLSSSTNSSLRFRSHLEPNEIRSRLSWSFLVEQLPQRYQGGHDVQGGIWNFIKKR